MSGTLDVHALIEQCRRGDNLSKIRAMVALERAGVEEAVDAMSPLLTSEDDGVRRAAADALGQLAGDRVTEVGPALLVLLADPEELVRNAAAEALGLLRYAPARPALERVLRHDDEWGVRASAAWALGELGDVQALTTLEAALGDEMDPVRAYVAAAIGQLGDTAQLPVIRRRLAIETHPQPKAELLAVALRFGDESAFDDLKALAQSAGDEELAYQVLGVVGDLLCEPTPAVIPRRAMELDHQIADLGRRVPQYAEWSAELRQRLAGLASSASDEK